MLHTAKIITTFQVHPSHSHDITKQSEHNRTLFTGNPRSHHINLRSTQISPIRDFQGVYFTVWGPISYRSLSSAFFGCNFMQRSLVKLYLKYNKIRNNHHLESCRYCVSACLNYHFLNRIRFKSFSLKYLNFL